MRDQAEKLRLRMLESQGALGRSIAIVSGKGGVGKSNFTTNFATLLAKSGKKVVILDMDIGMGNIHILIGKTVKYSLKDYLDGNLVIQDVTFEGPEGLHFISGGSGMTSIMEWSEKKFDRLIEGFELLQKEYDYVLFDMGAGVADWSLDLLTSINEMIVISTAEPTSIMDAYSMMKYIHMQDEHKTFYLLCNRAYNIDEGKDTINRLKIVMERFLSKEVVVLGSLPEDAAVRKAVRQQTPYVLLYPDAPISKSIGELVKRFLLHKTEEVHSPVKMNNFLSKLKSIFSKGRE